MSSSKASPIKNQSKMDSSQSDVVAQGATMDAEEIGENQPPLVVKKVDFTIRDDLRIKIEIPIEEQELLGSVTTLSSPAVRTSARVIQKMKLDLIRPTSPPPAEKKDASKEATGGHKTPVQAKPKMSWTNVERNLFFEALNESGKDFEAIAHYVNAKQKRNKSSHHTDAPSIKTKDHVRLLYYQTFHKVTKYLRFSDEIKKNAQELYGLINYGEMRKKLAFVNQKACMKLKELVYKGSVAVRVKGKNIRIKTPSCKALRKLNQFEEWQEEIKLPSKVDVYLRPANAESWSRVQGLAQNPRIRTVLPLQKRVLSLLKTMQLRWRSREARLCDQTMTMTNGPSTSPAAAAQNNPTNSARNHQHHSNAPNPPLLDAELTQYVHSQEPQLCLAPPPQTTIHRPMVNLVEFLSSYSICLNSYEDRIGVTRRGELLSAERLNSLKELIRSQSKRQRHDSASSADKKSPDCKRIKTDPDLKAEATGTGTGTAVVAMQSSSDEKCLDENEQLEPLVESSSADESDCKDDVGVDTAASDVVQIVINEFVPTEQLPTVVAAAGASNNLLNKSQTPADKAAIAAENRAKRKESKSQALKKRDHQRKENFRPLIDDEVIAKIMRGWSAGDVGDLTIGDLYIMFGHNFQVNLEYTWLEPSVPPKCKEEEGTTAVAVEVPPSVAVVDAKPVVATETEQRQSALLSNKLKQLLALANMADRFKRKPNCVCSHFGDKLYKSKHKDTDNLPRSFISNKIYPSSHQDNGVFRHPTMPNHANSNNSGGGGLGPTPIEAYRLNLLQHSRNKQNKWIRARNMRASSKQVVVQRLLPLQPGATQTYDIIRSTDNFIGPHKASIYNRPLNVRANVPDAAKSVNGGTSRKKTTNADSKPVPSSSASVAVADEVPVVTIEPPKPDDIPMDIDTSSTDSAAIRSMLMDISLPSPTPTISNIDEIFSYSNGPLMSPMTMLRQSPTDPKWFDDNVNDFSLSSFLGHLEAATSTTGATTQPNGSSSSSSVDTPIKSVSTSMHADIDGSRLSALADSVDYMSKFEEIAQSMLLREQSND